MKTGALINKLTRVIEGEFAETEGVIFWKRQGFSATVRHLSAWQQMYGSTYELAYDLKQDDILSRIPVMKPCDECGGNGGFMGSGDNMDMNECPACNGTGRVMGLLEPEPEIIYPTVEYPPRNGIKKGRFTMAGKEWAVEVPVDGYRPPFNFCPIDSYSLEGYEHCPNHAEYKYDPGSGLPKIEEIKP